MRDALARSIGRSPASTVHQGAGSISWPKAICSLSPSASTAETTRSGSRAIANSELHLRRGSGDVNAIGGVGRGAEEAVAGRDPARRNVGEVEGLCRQRGTRLDAQRTPDGEALCVEKIVTASGVRVAIPPRLLGHDEVPGGEGVLEEVHRESVLCDRFGDAPPRGKLKRTQVMRHELGEGVVGAAGRSEGSQRLRERVPRVDEMGLGGLRACVS